MKIINKIKNLFSKTPRPQPESEINGALLKEEHLAAAKDAFTAIQSSTVNAQDAFDAFSHAIQTFGGGTISVSGVNYTPLYPEVFIPESQPDSEEDNDEPFELRGAL